MRDYYTAKQRANMLNLKDYPIMERMDIHRPKNYTIRATFLKNRKDLHNWDHTKLIRSHVRWFKTVQKVFRFLNIFL